MIYVCGRRMSQPLSSSVDSSLWQPGDNALIRLPADCREGKKNAIIIHQVQLGACESTVRAGSSHIHPALSSLLCRIIRSDSYEWDE